MSEETISSAVRLSTAERLADFSARLSATENNIDELRSDVRAFKSEIGSKVEAVSAQMGTLIIKLNGNQGQYEGRRGSMADWWSTIGTLGSFLVVLGGAILWPVISDLASVANDVKEINRSYVRSADLTLAVQAIGARLDKMAERTETKVSQAEFDEYQKTVGAKFEGYRELIVAFKESLEKDINRNESRINNVDGSLIKRPELDRLDNDNKERNSALSIRLNDVEKELNTFGPADAIKELQARLNQIQYGAPVVLPQAPAKPAQ